MPSFSIKNLLVTVSLACFACLVLADPSLTMAKTMMMIVAIGILGLTVVGFWLRRPLAFFLAFLSIGYLVVADGGVFPSAERYLPTERVLDRCCTDRGTEISSGFKFRRSHSLTKWVLAVDRNHHDWRYVNPVKAATTPAPKLLAHSQQDTDDVLDALVDIGDSTTDVQPSVTIKLPALAMTSVSTVVSVGPRSSAQTRPYFIVGHCLIVTLLLAVAIAYFIAMSKRTSNTTTEPKQPNRSQ